MGSASGSVRDFLGREIKISVPDAVKEFAKEIVADFPSRPLGILFYGSAARTGDLSGLLDFYVLAESLRSLPGSRFIRWLNQKLPPNIYYARSAANPCLQAKIAVLTLEQFLRRCRTDSLDTTIWTRFSQPSRLVWSRDKKSENRIVAALEQALHTAGIWAAFLGTAAASPLEYWQNLFRRTYRAELRVEQSGRENSILQPDPQRYQNLLLESWKESGIVWEEKESGIVQPQISQHQKSLALQRWKKIELYGKALNAARLLKASLTFGGGIRYLSWKIERHSGIALNPSQFEQRHTLLGLPVFVFRLRKVGYFIWKRSRN